MGAVLVAATDGNHGCALARVARLRGLKAKIYISQGAAAARIQAISREGAEVIPIAGNYDDSVHVAAEAARTNGWTLVSDTSLPGYELVPRYIMAGYSMIMNEVAEQWTEPPDVVFVQAGVGGLACAVLSWLLNRLGSSRPFVVTCEPKAAACVLESMRADQPVIIPGSLETAMAGLSCGTVSGVAWPVLHSGLDACLAIGDDECFEAMRILAHPESTDPYIVSGESGACGLAALRSTMTQNDLLRLKDFLQLGSDSRVLVINTEAATDPVSYARVTGVRATDQNQATHPVTTSRKGPNSERF
jgi:diaminopropionate ammonia-lyase